MQVRVVALALGLFVCAAIAFYITVNTSLRIRFLNPGYASFISHGGQYKPDYYLLIIQDPSRDEIIFGKDFETLMRQYPCLTPPEAFPPGSYKSSNAPKGKRVLWLTPDDGFDFCIIVESDPRHNRFVLIKG